MKNTKLLYPVVVIIMFNILLLNYQKATGQISFTKKQYLQDFDQFIETVKSFNPQLPVRKIVTGYDAISEMEKLRTSVDTCNTMNSFTSLIYMALQCNLDLHVYFPGKEFIRTGISERKEEKLNYNKEKMMRIAEQIKNITEPGLWKVLPIKYINGEYFFTSDVSNRNKVYSAGSKITSINRKPIHEFVKMHLSDFYYAPQWDFKNKRYINEYLFQMASYFSDTLFQIEVNKDNASDVILLSGLKPAQKSGTFYRSMMVKVIDRILYIKIPYMENDTFYTNQIKGINGSELKGIIIDVRGNMGGSDLVWQRILSQIIKQKFEYDDSRYFLNNKMLKNYYGMSGPIYKHQGIEGIEFINFSGKQAIEPLQNSLNFSGKIVVIQDRNVFSGTANFIRAIAQYKNVNILGQPSGFLLGFEVQPGIFSLKNTNISFTLPTSVDFAGITQINEIYHSTVDIELETSLEYYQNLYSQNSHQEILKRDLFIQKAIEILSK